MQTIVGGRIIFYYNPLCPPPTRFKSFMNKRGMTSLCSRAGQLSMRAGHARQSLKISDHTRKLRSLLTTMVTLMQNYAGACLALLHLFINESTSILMSHYYKESETNGALWRQRKRVRNGRGTAGKNERSMKGAKRDEGMEKEEEGLRLPRRACFILGLSMVTVAVLLRLTET